MATEIEFLGATARTRTPHMALAAFGGRCWPALAAGLLSSPMWPPPAHHWHGIGIGHCDREHGSEPAEAQIRAHGRFDRELLAATAGPLAMILT